MTLFNNTKLKPELSVPIYQQIYEHLRLAILNGQLEERTKLPSTRALADELGVSRNTILNAYDQLAAEGYLERSEGKGTFVSECLPDAPPSPKVQRSRNTPRIHKMSERAASLLSAPEMPIETKPPTRGYRAFRSGMPALDAFPFELWAKLVSKHAHGLHPSVMAYQDPQGYRPLREAIADHVIVARQVHCSPEQVIIVSGSQGALHLASRVLLNAGDAVWVEDPGYLGAKSALIAAGAKLVPVPVDEDGLMVDAGIARAPKARLAYLTPSHQFPMGMTLSLKRRLALLEWAKQANAYVLEDDYDGEYRFDGRPLASLQGLDEHDSVIYIGTFSKVMFPAMRLGYLIVPPALVDAFLSMRRAIDVTPPHLEQAALADFIAEGHFTRHIRRMRTLYAERRTALLETARHLPLELYTPHTGMHLVGWLPDGVDDKVISARAAEQDVFVLAVSLLALEKMSRGGLVMGYASLSQEEMVAAVQRLGVALKGVKG